MNGTLAWIATADQMPADGQEVIAFMSQGQIRQLVRDSKYAGGWKQRNCAGWELVSWYPDSITHWRPEIFERPSAALARCKGEGA